MSKLKNNFEKLFKKLINLMEEIKILNASTQMKRDRNKTQKTIVSSKTKINKKKSKIKSESSPDKKKSQVSHSKTKKKKNKVLNTLTQLKNEDESHDEDYKARMEKIKKIANDKKKVKNKSILTKSQYKLMVSIFGILLVKNFTSNNSLFFKFYRQ